MQARTLLLIVAATLSLAACGSPQERAAKYVVNAQKYYDAGDLVKAKLEAQNAVQVAPRNAKARFLLADIAEKQKEYQQMFGHLQVGVTEDPANVEGRLKLATLLFLGQAWGQAQAQVDELLKRAPNDARVHLLQARLRIQDGDRPGGMKELDKALALDPDNVEGILLRAAAQGLENMDEGIATLEAGIKRLPADKSRQLRELRVLMLAQDKRTQDVETGLRELARDFPKEQGYQFQLAQFYSSQGRVEEADTLLKKVTEADPKNADKQLGYVQFLANQGNAEKAEAALKSFIQENPEASKLQLALALLYENTNRLDEARKTYAALGEKTPKTPEGIQARVRMAALDLRANKLDSGRAVIASILKDEPDESSALLLRSGVNYRDNKFDDAIADLRLVLRKEPNNDRALLLLANSYLRKNDQVLAKDTFRRVLEVAPDSPDGLQQLAALYIVGKEYPEAEALLRKRLEKAPDDLVSSGRLVEVLMAQGQAAKAEAEARRMTELKSQGGVGDFSLGRVLARNKDYLGAAEAFRKSVAARAGDPLPLEGLVRSLMAAGKSADAKTALTAQLENSQTQNYAKLLLGNIYGSEGDQAKAAAYLEDVVKTTPQSPIAWASLASIYKDREGRIGVLQRGVKAIPGNTDLQLLLGTEYELGGKFDDAIALYESMVKANPKFQPAANNLAALLLDRRTDKASYARALQLAQTLTDTDNPAMMDTVGWAYYRAGQYDDAVSTLERVVAKAGQAPVFRYHLGMAYLRAGNPVGARQQLAEAVDKAKGDYPGLAEARAELEKLKKPS